MIMKTMYLRRSVRRAFIIALSGIALLGFQVKAQEHAMDSSMAKQAHVMLVPDDLKWGAGPPGLPLGAQVVVMAGDPSKAGLFSLRLKFPANFTIPAHWHPTDEHVTVISGTLWMGMGEKTDPGKMKALKTGSYALMPAKSGHSAMAKEETIVQINGMGPFSITYYNPADDPRNKK
jgi:quercetin dioxygenase-like cupin family protein